MFVCVRGAGIEGRGGGVVVERGFWRGENMYDIEYSLMYLSKIMDNYYMCFHK